MHAPTTGPTSLQRSHNAAALGGNVCRPCASRHTLLVRASQAAPVTGKVQPDWTGDNILSRVVNWAINTPALYNIMKFLAKNAIKSGAEARNVSWDSHVRTMEGTQEVFRIKEELEVKGLQYPSYYLKPFHAYDEGNLNWLAAFEVEPATYAMALRTFKDETTLTPMEAFVKLRSNITDAVEAYYTKHKLASPQNIVDAGCSTGMSTRWLADHYPAAQVTGVDLSPHFLAVAEYDERKLVAAQQLGGRQRINYTHAVIEKSGMAAASLDMMALQFVIHECPQQVISDFITEAKRTLKKDGVLVMVDNNPKSTTIQNLPPALFTLMKSTEPWSDEYYSFDVEAAMREAGFRDVITVEVDHRHRTVLGIAA